MTDVGSWSLKSSDDSEIPLKKMTLRADIRDLLMTWKVCQTFRNTTDTAVEAIYTFPVAWSAVLTEFAAVVGGERLVAKAMPRATAEEDYESAHEAGDMPILLSADDNGIATVNLGNLSPGEEVVLELSFFSLLAPVNGVIRVTLPFSAGERYSSDGRQGKLEPYEQIETSLTAEYPVSAEFHVAGVLANCQFSVLTHPSVCNREGDGILITVKKAFADRNLVLLFEEVPEVNVGYLAEDPFRKDGWVSACVFTPPAGAEKRHLRVDVLADCSGSMSGVGIVKMREALAALTEVLAKDDELTFTRFGSSVVQEISTPRAFTKLFQRRTFQPMISRIEADLGGTEIGEALQAVFNMSLSSSETENRQRVVLLITDGEVWDIESIIEEIKEKDVPIFTIGVGQCAVEGHLQKIAAVSGGLCEVVTHAEEMTPVVERLMSSARSERVRLEADSATYRQYGNDRKLWPENGYRGTAVKVLARMKKRPTNTPTLKIFSSEGKVNLVAENSVVGSDDGSALAKAAAYLACGFGSHEGNLAVDYGLLTLDTSLLLVKERDRTQKEYSEKMVRVPQMATMPSVMMNYCQMPQCSYSLDKFEAAPVFLRFDADVTGSSDVMPVSTKEKVRGLGLVQKLFGRGAKHHCSAKLGMEVLDDDMAVENPLRDSVGENSSGAFNSDLEQYGFVAYVESWSRNAANNINGRLPLRFWQMAASELPTDVLNSLKQFIQEKFRQLSDEQCAQLVPAVMVLLTEATSSKHVLAEKLVVAAQDLIFNLFGPDDEIWKALKEPFCEAFYKQSGFPF